MSTISGNIGSERTYRDLKYGVDVVVEYVNDSIVLLREVESRNQRLCKREEFTRDEERFLPNND